jgi:hypothetical protein
MAAESHGMTKATAFRGRNRTRVAPRRRRRHRSVSGSVSAGYVKGDATHTFELEFVRIEPYVIPKVSLTGSRIERVDTRVLQIIYAFDNPDDRPVYVGQKMDLYLETL